MSILCGSCSALAERDHCRTDKGERKTSRRTIDSAVVPLKRSTRLVGTASLDGTRFEIPSRYRHLDNVHLQYARWNLSNVDLVDERTGGILCSVKPIDKSANASGQRRRLAPASTDLTPIPPKSLPALITKLLADYAATGLPPAYIPTMDANTP
jgi:putative transposase